MMRRLFLPLLALGMTTAMAAPIAAHAADYSIVIYESPAELAKRDPGNADSPAYWASFAAYGAEMAKAGILRGGAALVTAPDASHAPSGYFIIDVAGAAEADAWAAKAPSVTRGGSASARLHLPMAGK